MTVHPHPWHQRSSTHVLVRRGIQALLVAVACALLMSSSSALVAQDAQPAAERTPPTQAQLEERLSLDLDSFRQHSGVPAVGAALFDHSGVLAVAVSGFRTVKGEVPVTGDDLWHIGSMTKSFTATLIARLIQNGTPLTDDPNGPKLNWSTPLSAVLEESRNTPYARVTIQQLLGHRSGLSANAELSLMALRSSDLPIMEQRRKVVASMLSQPPLSEPGTAMLYSNNGYVLAGAIVERLVGKAWEEVLLQQVTAPLGLTSMGYGAPGKLGEVDQPQGHLGPDNDHLIPVKGPFADNPPFMGPAATIHISLWDLATYARLHLLGETDSLPKKQSDFLTAEAFRRLHASLEGQSYAMGWDNAMVPKKGSTARERLIWHNGSNTMWYTYVGLFPESGDGILVTINAGLQNAAKVNDFALLLHRKYSLQ